MANILIVDDDPPFRQGLRETLGERLGHSVHEAASGEEALKLLTDVRVDLMFLDLRMPGMDGLEVLRRVRADAKQTALPVVVLTAYASGSNTIEAMKLGAFDHLTKPVGREDILSALARALSRPQPVALLERPPLEDELIGASAALRAVHKLIGMAAASDVTVLVTGETGTGKECVARALHAHGARSRHPFVAVNCAAIPADLLESELFGHVRGAFTGAVVDRPGRFREADGGTLFLDEVGDMSLSMQAKVLRVLQEREVKPVGGTKGQVVDVRIVAATNRDLPALVKCQTFRSDLFYRLNVLHIPLPPLRSRGSDILLLAESFLQRVSPGSPKRVSAAAAKVLLGHDWPGNVRELQNVIQRLSVIVRGPVIDRADLGVLTPQPSPLSEAEDLMELGFHGAIAQLEKQLIAQALAAAGGNRTEAARRLGVNRQLLYMKLKEHGFTS